MTDFGLFVELEEGIEGLVHVSEISKEKIKSPVGQYKTGDQITAKVINISPKDRKIGLSIKKVQEQEERTNYEDYVDNAKAATSNLGELLKEEMEARATSALPVEKVSQAVALNHPVKVLTRLMRSGHKTG